MKERRENLKFLTDDNGRGRRSSSASAEEKQTSDSNYTSWQTAGESWVQAGRCFGLRWAGHGQDFAVAVYSNFYASLDRPAPPGRRLGLGHRHSPEVPRVRHHAGGRQATAGEPIPGQGV